MEVKEENGSRRNLEKTVPRNLAPHVRRDREVLEGKEGLKYILDFYKQEYSDLTYPVEKGRVITSEGE